MVHVKSRVNLIIGLFNRISLALVWCSFPPTRRRFESRLPPVLLLEHRDTLERRGCAILWVSAAFDKSLYECERE